MGFRRGEAIVLNVDWVEIADVFRGAYLLMIAGPHHSTITLGGYSVMRCHVGVILLRYAAISWNVLFVLAS